MSAFRRILQIALAVATILAGPAAADPAAVQTGLAVTERPGYGFDRALADALAAGVRHVELPVFWMDVEREPGVLAPDPDWAAIADAVYAGAGLGVTLSFVALTTHGDARPEWWRGRDWDDPALVEAYWRALERTLEAMPDVRLVGVSLSNEVDVPLAGRPDEQAAFLRLVEAVAPRLRALRPGVPVGTKVTVAGLLGPDGDFVRRLAGAGDVAMLTYYPLDAEFRVLPVADGMALLDRALAALPGATVHLSEVGVPTAPDCGGSGALQADYVRAVFAFRARHADRLPVLLWVWQADLTTEAAAAETAAFPGLMAPCFRRFFETLGLREADGRPKPGWDAFAEAARALPP